MTASTEGLLVTRDIFRGFGTGPLRQEVICGVSLHARAGELTIIIGPSGSGKTTLLGLLSGLLKPDRGTIECFGTRLDLLTPTELGRFRLRHSGFVFQGFNLFSSLTALEQVMLPLSYADVAGPNRRQMAATAIARVGLEKKAGFRPRELSGGEKQRVAIARAIAKVPRLLFADEPTSALDSANALQIVALFKELAHAYGTGVLCVTHDERLLAYADRIYHLRDGTILEDAGASPP